MDIELKDGVLTVSGERKTEHEEQADTFYRVERGYGTFSRSMSLPGRIDVDRITATFENGILEVRIPKPEERKPQRVEIGAPTVSGTAQEK